MLTITSEPPGAAVIVNDEYIGDTPKEYRASRAEEVYVELHLEGYHSEYRQSIRSTSRLGNIDSVGGALLLLPFLGLLAPGAWEHHPNTFTVKLYPLENENPD